MYLPGYYSMKDISNGNGYSSWSLPHESNSLKNGQHYGMYLSTPITGGVDYDVYEKEKLRQTIMKHESIFRHQVHELHRLYRIQRDLMSEIRSKEQVNHLMPVGTSQPSLFSSGFPSENDKRSWHASSFPLVGSNFGRPSSSGADVIQLPQSSLKVTPLGARLKEYEPLDLKCKKPQRRLFDLEVPAEEYIDDEMEVEGDFMASGTENHRFSKSNEVTQVGDNNSSRHAGDDGNTLKSSLYSRGTHNLADLNEPVEVEEISASASDNNLGSEIYSQEQIQSQAVSTQVYSNMWFAAKQLSENAIFVKNGGIGNLHVKSESNGKQCSPYGSQAEQIRSKIGFEGSYHVEDFRKPCDSTRAEFGKRANGFITSLPSDHNTSGKQVKRKIFGVEVAEGNNDASSFASRAINVVNSESSSISSWTKPQSSLNPSVIQCGPQGHLWSPGRANSAKAVSDVATPNKYQSDVIHKDNGVSFAEPRKLETPVAVLPWLRTTLPLDNGVSSEMSSRQVSNQTDMRKGPMQSPVQDSSSTTRGHDAENRRVETSDCSSVKRILGFPIFDLTTKPDSVVSVLTANDSPLKTTSVKGNSGCCQVSSSSEEKLKVEDPKKGLVKESSCLRHQIDLNECVVEEETHLTASSPNAKPTTGIDLEAPVVVETDSDEETFVSKLERPSDSLVQESRLPHESLDKVAAEALFAMASYHLHNLLDDAVFDLQENDAQTSPSNSLYLLADIISSYRENSQNEAETSKTLSVYNEETICDDVDDFEHIILNLPETKLEECYIPPSSDEPEEEEETVAPRRPRRGQARRGRQRVKDFQRDVLPGMVSLSRNEVTEDLQTIEGLVRATGGTWQSSLALRNGGRGSGGRGRRRSVAASAPPPMPPTPPEAVVCHAVQAQQPSDSKEPGLEETSLAGWGKRTRRPPRQRCPNSNSLLPLK